MCAFAARTTHACTYMQHIIIVPKQIIKRENSFAVSDI